MAGKILVTSALPYANGRVHLGHLAGAYLPADIYVRWMRLRGAEVKFVCGSDEHGIPIALTAMKSGRSPQEVVDDYHPANGEAFAAAEIKFDIWGRTSDPEHHCVTQEFFLRMYKQGLIVKQETMQLYSERSQMFLPDRYVEGTCPLCGYEQARGDQCERCGGTYEVTELKDPRVAIEGDGSTPVLRKTAHWFLCLDKLAGRVEEFVDGHGPGSAQTWRSNAQREAKGWLKRGLRPRAITRDTTWGVKIPLSDPDQQDKRIYVWFDAPIGYVTFTRQLFANEKNPEGWKDYWQNPDCPIIHFIGKDNIAFHAVMFPAMLIAVNGEIPPGERAYQLASQVVANEFLNFGADKFSKSRGNVIEVGWFAEKFGSDALRYYLTAIAPESNDGVFTWEDFLQRYNGELADVLGNFVHRVLTFAVQRLGGIVPDPGGIEPHALFVEETETAVRTAGELIEAFQFRNALATILSCARGGNVFFDQQAPWRSLTADPGECRRVIYVSLLRVAALGLALRPILPRSAAAILRGFGVDEPFAPGSASLSVREIVRPGLHLSRPEVLFRKLEPQDVPAFS